MARGHRSRNGLPLCPCIMAQSYTEGERKQPTDGCSTDPEGRPPLRPPRPASFPPSEEPPASTPLLYPRSHAGMEVARNVGMLDERVEGLCEFRVTWDGVLVSSI